MLRAALATGCGLWIPLLLAAEEPKQGSKPSAKPAAAPAKKVSQATARYQPRPNGDQKCGTCMNFIAESNTCKLVEGKVAPEGWCTLWAKKA